VRVVTSLEAWFAADGPLAQVLSGYEPRPEQVTLAQGLADALEAGEAFVGEAGTGVGKSLSYLLALAAAGQRAILATHTKALQDQLCVAPETRVLTADLRYIRAGDVRVGMTLLGFEEERSGFRRHFGGALVEAVSLICRPSYALVFEDGTTVIASAEHLWLVNNNGMIKWMESARLYVTTGKRLGSKVIKLLDVWDTDTSYAAGYLAAAFDGEG
jgi:hypothetical protein